MALNIVAYIPIMTPLPMMQNQCQLQRECLTELGNLSAGLPPIDPAFGGSLMRVHWVDDPAKEPLLADKWQLPLGVRKYSLFVVEIDAQAYATDVRETAEFPEDDPVKWDLEILSEQVTVDAVEYEIHNLLLLANILYPGAISASEGYVFVNGEYSGKTKAFYAEDLFGAITAASTLGWPKFFPTPFVEAWAWLQRSGALKDGIGIGRLGRAIAAVSHLTTADLQRGSSIDLMWILLGLEALYSKGNVGLKEQLLGKTESILGPRTENKKLFGGVYDFRSRLLHGDVDIPLRFTEFNAVKKFEDFHGELLRSEELALAVLIATLQWMAKNKANELEFTYTLISATAT